ncbi:hypothetical protein MHU86_19663 [Fragilaria crotonensis]|nr:hypothetical protein MHU86_19663 [Fragilaria crotonensis]
MRAVKSGPRCDICNDYRTDMKCSEGHALCTICIKGKLGDYSGCQLLCLIKECSSKVQDTDLYGRIPIEMYNRGHVEGGGRDGRRQKDGDERNVAETAADATGVGRRSGPVTGSISATGSGSVQGVTNKRRDLISLNTNAGIQHPAAMSAVDSGPSCLVCKESRMEKCSEGHAVCTACIVDKLGDDKGCQLLCLFKEC